MPLSDLPVEERYRLLFFRIEQKFRDAGNVDCLGPAIEAVAVAAVTDVLTRMIADAIGQDDDYSVVGYEGSYAVSHQSLEDYLRSHLPTPAPTAEEGETDHA